MILYVNLSRARKKGSGTPQHSTASKLAVIELKIMFIKFCNKFWIKQVQFLQSRCTSLLLRSKPVQQNCLRFLENFKKLHAPRVNETKVTSRNAFIVIFFVLESGKESKNKEKTLFWDYPWILDLSVNP